MSLLVFVCSTLCHVLYFVFLALPCHVLSCPVLPFPTPVLLCPARLPCHALFLFVLSCQAQPCLALPNLLLPCLALPCPCAVLCYYYYLLVWTVPTPINKDGPLFVLIYLFYYLILSFVASLPAPYQLCDGTLGVGYARCRC
jgi:hypothetical protein